MESNINALMHIRNIFVILGNKEKTKQIGELINELRNNSTL